LVDLPGYGFAKTSHTLRKTWEVFIRKYLLKRENLYCVFVLIDSRHEPQQNDIEFMSWLGEEGIPFVIVFTKTDKLKKIEFQVFKDIYATKLLEYWEELPQMFITSSETKLGREEILDFIDQINKKN